MSISNPAGTSRGLESDGMPPSNQLARLTHVSQPCPVTLQEANRLLGMTLDIDFVQGQSKLQACQNNARLFLWGLICGETGGTFFAAQMVALPVWKELIDSLLVPEGELAYCIVDATFVHGRQITWDKPASLRERWLVDLLRPYLNHKLLGPPLLEEPILLLLKELWEKAKQEAEDPVRGQEKLCLSLLALCQHLLLELDLSEHQCKGLFQLPSLLLGWSALLDLRSKGIQDRIHAFVQALDWAIA